MRGFPIRDPITGKLLGVVDLTCWASLSDPLLFVLAKSAGSQIEDRISAFRTEGETALLEAYLKQTGAIRAEYWPSAATWC